MAVRTTYECSSEGAERHWEIPWTRLSNAVAPTPTQPAYVVTTAVERALRHGATGTILSTDILHPPSVAVIDFGRMVYKHNLRNVLTYAGGAGGAEASWGAVNIGDPVYYDDSVNMPADYFLSLAPANNEAAPKLNMLFGYVVAADEADAATFPKASAAATSLTNVAILQLGA